MSEDQFTINREASDKTKGFRLQKLRAIELMLDSIARLQKPMIYSAIEYVEDVYLKDRSNKGKELFEEDKNYNPDSKFTFNSHQVVNTLVSFIDIWFKWSNSENLVLGFYSTNNYTKESTSKVITANLITLPDKAILELLIAKNFKYSGLIECVKKFIVAEYKSQYSDPAHPGRIGLIEKMDEQQWILFLSCINWQFGVSDEQIKKQEVIEKIKSSKYYNNSHCDKEETIFNQLMEMFDERQNLADLTEKFVHGSEIHNVFLQASVSGNALSADPVWEIWNNIEKSDSRNLSDKIQSVCAIYNSKKIQIHSQKVTRSLIEQEKLVNDKSILSIRYRVFEHCQEVLFKYLEEKSNPKEFSESEIDEIIALLNKEANDAIKTLGEEFKYSFINNKLIDGLILELFDSCFLAFD